jgi:NADP-dependent alcohol dehydrogenase
MRNFIYHNPTKIIFGENVLYKISAEIPANARIMLTYGGGSIKKNGIYHQVVSVLEDFFFIEFGGIEPNPQYSTLMKAVDLCRKEKIDFLLSVGGGSVLDGTKFIAAASLFDGEPWDILENQLKVTSVIPFGAVLTLPATGSEMNAFAVISRKETGQKLDFGTPPFTYPRFSVLDPNFTRTLPHSQRINGVIDAFVHVTEQYLTFQQNAPLNDRFAEAIMKTLIEEGLNYVNEPENMTVAKDIMWCSTMALNGLIATGLITDWATHKIGHELTVLHNIDHASTLAIVWPGMMRVMSQIKKEKLLQYAERIWDINNGDDEERIEKAISKTEAFFISLGAKTRLSDYKLNKTTIVQVVENLKRNGFVAIGEQKLVTPEKVIAILESRM